MDNAATTFPKPKTVIEAMVRFMETVGANTGRSRHGQAQEALRIVDATRESLARLFHVPDPNRIVFTANATESLNTVIFGALNPGDHAVMTMMEHNSVIRPLRLLERSGRIALSVIPCDRMGFCDTDALRDAIRPNTALVVVNHASNVCGSVQDLVTIRHSARDVPLLVDAAQTAGAYPIDVQSPRIDYLAFTGHKGLFGPQGTGGLYIREGLRLRPLKVGGTGRRSELEEQPEIFPDLFESGTRNGVGIAGLGAAVDFVLSEGVDRIRRHESAMLSHLVNELRGVAGLTLYGPLDPERQLPIVSITFDAALPDGLRHSFGGCGGRAVPATFESVHPQEAGSILEETYDISVRVGLHCAPLAHKALGTYPDGTVRFSLSYFNTLHEVDIAISAVKRLADRQT
jgi:cysteine desulfurase family protein